MTIGKCVVKKCSLWITNQFTDMKDKTILAFLDVYNVIADIREYI